VDLATSIETEQLLTIHIPGSLPDDARGCLQFRSSGFTSAQVSIAEEAAAMLGQAMLIRETVNSTCDQSNRRHAALTVSTAALHELPTPKDALVVAMSMMCALTDSTKAYLALCEDGWWASGAALRVVELSHEVCLPAVPGLSFAAGDPTPVLKGYGVLVEDGATDDVDAASAENAQFAETVLDTDDGVYHVPGGMCGVPLKTAEGQLFAVVVMHDVSKVIFEDDVQGLVAAMQSEFSNKDLPALVLSIRDTPVVEAVAEEAAMPFVDEGT